MSKPFSSSGKSYLPRRKQRQSVPSKQLWTRSATFLLETEIYLNQETGGMIFRSTLSLSTLFLWGKGTVNAPNLLWNQKLIDPLDKEQTRSIGRRETFCTYEELLALISEEPHLAVMLPTVLELESGDSQEE